MLIADIVPSSRAMGVSAYPGAVSSSPDMNWWVYVLVSETTGETYVGVTNDLERRVEQHNGERPGGAKTTRRGRPWSIGATHGPFASRGEAQAAEHRVKSRRGRDRLGDFDPREDGA